MLLVVLQTLLLALRLWSRCSPAFVAQCPLLPSGVQPPSKGFFTAKTAETADHPVAAAEAFFAGPHLQKALTALRLSSSSHPRLHSLWPTLFALLIPGFTASKVRHLTSLHCPKTFMTILCLADNKYISEFKLSPKITMSRGCGLCEYR